MYSPPEPFRIKSVAPIRQLSGSEREAVFEKVRHNPLRLRMRKETYGALN